MADGRSATFLPISSQIHALRSWLCARCVLPFTASKSSVPVAMKLGPAAVIVRAACVCYLHSFSHLGVSSRAEGLCDI